MEAKDVVTPQDVALFIGVDPADENNYFTVAGPNGIMASDCDVAYGRVIDCQWHGGPYIELGFGLVRPTEVINVWDYATGSVAGGVSFDDMSTIDKVVFVWREVAAWIQSHVDDGWHDWYEDYVENAR